MALTEDQAAKIILIRSIEECDKGVFSDQILADALAAAKNQRPGLDWIEKRASYLFEHLSAWYQSILQLAKAPANWILPVCFLAVILGLATNLLAPTERIHVVRNPVFFLVSWNFIVYLALFLLALPGNRARIRSGSMVRFKPQARPEHGEENAAPSFEEKRKIPFTARYLLPSIWQLIHKIMFGFQRTKNLAHLTSHFTMHWFSIAGPLVVARWRYLLHLAALCVAAGAIGGMYFRGLFQSYEFVWASTFVTDQATVSTFVNVLFGPSLFISRLLNLGLSERIDIARLLTPQGDSSDAWIHLFAITVATTIVIPRGLLALAQFKNINGVINAFPLALDKYYGEVIEAPIRSVMEKEAETAITQFAEKIASYVGLRLYDEQIIPKLRDFRENGGKISDLKSELIRLTESFSPQLKAYIVDVGIPEFQSSLSQRVGDIIKSIGSDFVNKRASEATLHDLKIHAPKTADLGVSDQFSTAIGASVGAAITLTFAAIGGGIGEELGIAIIATVLGTTGPVGFVIGLVIGALVVVGGWRFGKEKITETIEHVSLPAVVVRSALWESRFKKLIDDGRKQCEDSVRTNAKERLLPMLPNITDEIVFRLRSWW
jgi:hypothetical protein